MNYPSACSVHVAAVTAAAGALQCEHSHFYHNYRRTYRPWCGRPSSLNRDKMAENVWGIKSMVNFRRDVHPDEPEDEHADSQRNC